MNINVTTKNVTIDSENLNKGEYNIRECNFTFSEEYDDLVCKALFTVSKTKLTYEQSIVNGKCEIPYEATVNRGKVILGVIGYEIENEELVKRYSPKPDEFFVLDGSYVEDIENQSTPTPSDLEQLEQRVSQVEIDAAQVEINTQDISDIKGEQLTQNDDISDLQTNKADKTELPTKTSDLTNDNGFIDNSVDNLINYTLTTQTGSKIDLEINSSNYQLVAKLYDKNNTLISTSTTIDLPIESMVVSATYDNTNKKIVLTLQNGQTIDVPVGDLVAGLVSDTDYATSSKGGVIKVSDSYNSAVASLGYLYPIDKTYQQYLSGGTTVFISKGTLENVITGKNLETANNKVTSLSSSSTDTQYPSAKCVYDLVGNIETILEELDIRRWRRMSISTRITSMQEHIGDIYDTLELGGVDLTNVDKNIINISPKLRQKYLDYMNNGTQEIWNNWEKVPTGIGENVILNNTVQAPMNVTVKGNSEQVQYSGKNLANINVIPNKTTGQPLVTVANDTITISNNGNTVGYTNTGIKLSELCPDLKVGDVAYLFFDTTSSSTSKNTIYIGEGWGKNLSKTITQAMLDSNVVLYGGYEETAKISNFMITKENNNTYEPYVGGTASPNPSFPQPITNVTGDVEVLVQNKNLFDINGDINTRANGTTSNYNSIANGKLYTTLNYGTQHGYGQKIYVGKGNTLTVSCKLSDVEYSSVPSFLSNAGTICLYPEESLTNFQEIPWTYSEVGQTKIRTITALSDYVTIAFGRNAATTGAYFDNIQLELGTTATPYVPHQQQTFTFPLGTQRMYLGDYLADDGIHHVRGQYAIKGTENWKDFAQNANRSKATLLISLVTPKIKLNAVGLSNCYVYAGKISSANLVYGQFSINDTLNLSGSATLTTLNEFKSWLAEQYANGTPVVIEYELAEEEITPYTTEQQQAYDEIKQAISYEEQTNISGESDEANPIFTVVALKNI